MNTPEPAGEGVYRSHREAPHRLVGANLVFAPHASNATSHYVCGIIFAPLDIPPPAITFLWR